MRQVLWVCVLCLTVVTSSGAGQVQYVLATGEVTGCATRGASPPPGCFAGSATVPVPAGYGVLTVADPIVWPVPAAGAGYTTCPTGRREWTLVQGSVLVANQAKRVFRCVELGSRRDAFDTETALELMQTSGSAKHQAIFPVVLAILQECPTAGLSGACDTARALATILADAQMTALIQEMRAFFAAKGL
jgi:hypothetical protein